MDDHDWKELSARKIERQRQEKHFERYGSILWCPDRGTICAFMEEPVKNNTECLRTPCILDDPEDQELQRRIQKNRKQAIEAERAQIREEKDRAPIRDQRNLIRSHVNREMAEIHRLEEASRKAFSNNKPGYGQQLFTRAGIRRQKLKKWQEEHEEKEFVNV